MNLLMKSSQVNTAPSLLWQESAQQRCIALLQAGRVRLENAAHDAIAWHNLQTEWTTFIRNYADDTRPNIGAIVSAEILSESKRAEFRLQNIRLTTSSGWQIGLNLFLPTSPGPYVPVLCPCGHGPKWQDDHQIPPQVLARNGFAAALFDMPMFGEHELGNDHFIQGPQALMAGLWSNHFFLCDAILTADYLQTRGDMAFSRGLGVTGVSGGGFSTLFLAQLDKRVTAIAPVCSITSLRGHIVSSMYTGCPENYMQGQCLPGLDLDNLLCLAAPLPCLVIGGARDELFMQNDTTESVLRARMIYEALDVADRLAFYVEDSPHKYTARMAVETAQWFRRWLLDEPARQPITAAPLLSREELDCGTSETTRTIFDFVSAASERLQALRASSVVDVSNAAIANALNIVPQEAVSIASVEDIPMDNPWHYRGLAWKVVHAPDDLPLPILDLSFPDAPQGTVVCFGDLGKLQPVRMSDGLWGLRQRAISADLRGFGELTPDSVASDLYSWSAVDRALADLLLLCGHSALGQQTMDALRVLNAMLHDDSAGDMIIYGHGEASLPALFAGLLHPKITHIVLDSFLCSFDELTHTLTPTWSRYQYLPAVLKEFDLPDIFRGHTDKQFLLVRPLDARKRPLDEIAAIRLYGAEWPNITLHAPTGDINLKAVVKSWLERQTATHESIDPVLAIHGGKPVCERALPSKWHGVDLIGQAELDRLEEVVRTKSPFRHYGPTSHVPIMAQTLEQRIARKFGVKYALAVTSGSAALSCALAGLGIGPGDEVILPAFAWISCYNSIVLAGALPVFCDIDTSLTCDPMDIERKITPATKAIMVVNYQGGSADLNAIAAVARKHEIKVLEDNAQSAGARYRGRYLGSFGDVSILSFQTAKIMTSGEGGMVLTNDALIFERAVRYHDLGFLRPTFDAQIMRQAGITLTPDEQAKRQFSVDATFTGSQYRMNELSAAVALAQLDRLEWVIERCHSIWDAIQHHVTAAEIGVCFRRTNDYDGDAGITLFVDLQTSERAHAFKEALAAEIPNLGPSSHVSNLLAEEYVQTKQMHHPTLPPFGAGFNGADVVYSRDIAPNADALPARMVGIGIGPRYTHDDAEIIGAAIVKVHRALFGEGDR